MAPRVLRVDPQRPDPRAIEEACAVLRAGGLVAFPTETVYGLGASGLDARAVERIFAAKGRPSTHPLILHVAGEEGARAVTSDWSDRAAAIARAFWPGPITIVVPRGARVPEVVTGGGSTVAVRCPAHPVARALLAALSAPLAAPSANKYQTLSPTAAAHVVKSLGDAVDLVLDGGACPGGIESTVVDVTGARPRVLRPGGISLEAIRAVLPDVESAATVVAEGNTRASPGMDARHYAPRATMRIAPDRGDAVGSALSAARAGARVGLVLRGGDPLSHDGVLCRVLPDDPAAYARDLFATLHALEDAGVTRIEVEPLPADDAWHAIADRLRRGASA